MGSLRGSGNSAQNIRGWPALAPRLPDAHQHLFCFRFSISGFQHLGHPARSLPSPWTTGSPGSHLQHTIECQLQRKLCWDSPSLLAGHLECGKVAPGIVTAPCCCPCQAGTSPPTQSQGEGTPGAHVQTRQASSPARASEPSRCPLHVAIPFSKPCPDVSLDFLSPPLFFQNQLEIHR